MIDDRDMSQTNRLRARVHAWLEKRLEIPGETDLGDLMDQLIAEVPATPAEWRAMAQEIQEKGGIERFRKVISQPITVIVGPETER